MRRIDTYIWLLAVPHCCINELTPREPKSLPSRQDFFL